MVKKKKEKKLKVTLTIDRKIFNKFRQHCAVHGMKISSRVEKLIEKDLLLKK